MFFKKKPKLSAEMASMVNINLIVALAIKMNITPRELLDVTQDLTKINEFLDIMNKLMLEKVKNKI